MSSINQYLHMILSIKPCLEMIYFRLYLIFGASTVAVFNQLLMIIGCCTFLYILVYL